ncbi:MAG: transposase [Burkholderiales bacterium]
MAGKRNKYPREFKIEAVKRVVEDRVPQAHVARELGISINTLAGWKRAFQEDPEHSFPGNGKQKPDDAELTRLKRENARLKEDLEILKKAAAYFAKHSR